MLGQRGFTLIELAVVLLITALLAVIGSELYQGYIQRSQRAQAVVLLQENALFLEEFFHQHGSYKQTPTRWPELRYALSPPTGTAYYRMTFGSTPHNTDEGYYVLRASRLSPSDEAETISLTQTGIMKLCIKRDGVEHCELVH